MPDVNIKGITDTHGIKIEKLKHIFLGCVDIKNKRILGYHCDNAEARDDPDVLCRVEKKEILEPAAIRLKENCNLGIEKGTVMAKQQGVLIRGEKEITKFSTFFNHNWTRQQIVDGIEKLKKSAPEQKLTADYLEKNPQYAEPEKKTGIYVMDCADHNVIVVDCISSTYPIIRI